MSFLFNFPTDDEPENENSATSQIELAKGSRDDNAVRSTPAQANCIQAKEVTEFCDKVLTQKFGTIRMELGEHNFTLVDTSRLGSLLLEDKSFKDYAEAKNLVCALSRNSDLEAGIYEGGLTMWECGEDLSQFLSSHPIGQSIELKGKDVLELGCGAGLPGIYCCCCGARSVHFQDFNEEVLQLVTHTNVTHNVLERNNVQCQYFSGDWSSFGQLLKKREQIYDIILTAETIYSPDNYSSLHNVFDAALSDKGVVIIAAKVYYFGVGGSTDGFIEFVESQKCFTAEIMHTIKAGVPRKILLLRRKEMKSLFR